MIHAAGAPVVCETPGEVEEMRADLAFVRAALKLRRGNLGSSTVAALLRALAEDPDSAAITRWAPGLANTICKSRRRVSRNPASERVR